MASQRMRIIKLEDGSRWEVLSRGCFEKLTGRQLLARQQKIADYERARGYERLADQIESMGFFEWAHSESLFSYAKRIS